MDEKHSRFRALALAQPAKMATKPPLPQQKLQAGIATFAEAAAAQAELAKDYYTAVGKDASGYYVKAPDAATLAYLKATEA